MDSVILNEVDLQRTTPFLRTRLKLLADSAATESDATFRTLQSIGNLPNPQSLYEFFRNGGDEVVGKGKGRMRSLSPEDEDDEGEVVGGCICQVKRGSIRSFETAVPIYHYLHAGHDQSVFLLDLPTELLQHIAFYIRYSSFTPYPIPPAELDQALNECRQFISHHNSTFSEARFALSSLTRVCRRLRPIGEGMLYKDISLDFKGWAGRKHPRYPPGSLKLLLHTLDKRPDLRRHISSVSIDYFSHTGAKAQVVEEGLERFLAQLPNLTRLVIAPCPVKLWSIPLDKVRTFATTYAPDILPAILDHFPNLRHLHLQGNIPMSLSSGNHGSSLGRTRKHQMAALSIASDNWDVTTHFLSIMRLCGNTVSSLDFRFLGSLVRSSPYLPELAIFSGFPETNVRKLRIDNMSVLSNTWNAFPGILRSMTMLEELHLSHHNRFDSKAFTFLPPNLRRLLITDYFGIWDQPDELFRQNSEVDYGEALGHCVSYCPERLGLQGVVVRLDVGKGGDTWDISGGIIRHCNGLGVQVEIVKTETALSIEFEFEPKAGVNHDLLNS